MRKRDLYRRIFNMVIAYFVIACVGMGVLCLKSVAGIYDLVAFGFLVLAIAIGTISTLVWAETRHRCTHETHRPEERKHEPENTRQDGQHDCLHPEPGRREDKQAS